MLPMHHFGHTHTKYFFKIFNNNIDKSNSKLKTFFNFPKETEMDSIR